MPRHRGICGGLVRLPASAMVSGRATWFAGMRRGENVTMRHYLAVLCTILALGLGSSVAAAQNAPQPTVTKPPAETPMRVLFIGNSLLYTAGGLQTHVHSLGAADKPPLDLEPGYKSVHITDATLDQYPLDWLIVPGHLGIAKPFQVVVLAGKSTDAITDKSRDAYRTKVLEFNKIIKEHGAETALYWLPSFVKPNRFADKDLLKMNESMIVPLANQIGAIVIPVGPAYAEAYHERPELQLQSFDGNHPTVAGQYLSACVVYATLYGRSPVGNPYNSNGEIDDSTRLFLQKVALDTVNKFFGR